MDDVTLCRGKLDQASVKRVKELLTSLPRSAPDALASARIKASEYPLLLSAAVESLRGTASATTTPKRRFCGAVLDHMARTGHIVEWEFLGSSGRQDYRVVLPGGYRVAIEAKGCPDGNNMTIWERPSWAREFVVWSQCPDSLRHHPGVGVWKGIATRLLPHTTAKRELVDALVFYDGRCGSDLRRCPKLHGVNGPLRKAATDIPGQDGRAWLPPPSVYLFPSTIAHPTNDPCPVVHTLEDCRFARAMLSAFHVPRPQQEALCHWARIELDQRKDGVYKRISVGLGLGEAVPSYGSGWTRLRRE
jgi:hypothetical protein